MIIVGGTATNGIDENIAKAIQLKLVKVEHRVFPDGESYIRVPEFIYDKDVLIIQSLYPPQNKHLVELELLLDTLVELGIQNITAVIPYLAYSRQNKRFREGEAISIKTVLKLMYALGAKSIVVVEPHSYDEMTFFGGTVKIIDPFPYLAEQLSLNDPLVVAPDRGAKSRALRFASKIGAEVIEVQKERDRVTGEVKITNIPQFDFKEREVIIVDDIISTGTTIANVAKNMMGAKKVIAVAVHSLLNEVNYNKLLQSGISEVIVTNTIPTVYGKVIDISPLIVQQL
ncbi:ribose-phosphate pyrophosphokinase [Sulfolobales archaeon HS-7]|nr:ribose-phosphate pyrophosphokinase [Sulfolobales archaeon HS-7]